jgi:hypothetical protein
VVVEIQDWGHVVVHHDVAETVDSLLRGHPIEGEVRTRDEESGEVRIEEAQHPPSEPLRAGSPARPGRPQADLLESLRIFPFGIGRHRLEQAVRELRLPVTITNHVQDADLVLTLRNYYRRKPEPLRDAESQGVPVYVLKSNTVGQMESALASVFNLGAEDRDPTTVALEEAEQAIAEVLERSRTIELSPQNSHIRRLQHQLAERYNIGSRSRGKEPNRRVKFFPREYDDIY